MLRVSDISISGAQGRAVTCIQRLTIHVHELCSLNSYVQALRNPTAESLCEYIKVCAYALVTMCANNHKAIGSSTACIHIYMYVYMHAYMYVYIYIYIYVYIHEKVLMFGYERSHMSVLT
jgi:hypothetical protein